VSDDAEEAAEARRRAEEALLAARRQTGEIRRVAAHSQRHLRINHFAQLIDETFRGAR
jgi:hypothetical protein